VRLHQKVASGYLGSMREEFYDLMDTDNSHFPRLAPTRFSQLIVAEATKVGLTTKELDGFKCLTRLAAKNGHYTYPSGNHDHSIGGYLRLPVAAGGKLQFREYVVGAFVNITKDPAALQHMGNALIEALRGEVNAAMRTIKGANLVCGGYTAYGQGCRGSNKLLLAHDGSGVAVVGVTANLNIRDALPRATLLLFVGAQANTVSLHALGAIGCFAHIDQMNPSPVPLIADRGGSASLRVVLPNDVGLVGVSVFTQALAPDPTANTAKFITSNGVKTTIGGKK
jgi:hypothetical protein